MSGAPRAKVLPGGLSRLVLGTERSFPRSADTRPPGPSPRRLLPFLPQVTPSQLLASQFLLTRSLFSAAGISAVSFSAPGSSASGFSASGFSASGSPLLVSPLLVLRSWFLRCRVSAVAVPAVAVSAVALLTVVRSPERRILAIPAVSPDSQYRKSNCNSLYHNQLH